MDKHNLHKYCQKILRKSKEGSFRLNSLPTRLKNRILLQMAKALWQKKDYILCQNHKDLVLAQKLNLSAAFIDRLRLDRRRVKKMSTSLKEIAALQDPVGEIMESWRRPNGILIKKVRVPLGVIFIIYESRPNVTADCIGLSLKSSNYVILRGGKESLNSNRAIFDILLQVAHKNGLDNPFYLVDRPDRNIIDFLLQEGVGFIDLVIPRGGEGLIKRVTEISRVPVLKHYKGVCHIYVDESADLNKALKVCLNAKVQRPGVCNAMETLLVHKDIAPRFLPLLEKEYQKYHVELRGCSRTRKIIPVAKRAKEGDWYSEYLDLILAVKVVENVEEAVAHINKYGSLHTESIISRRKKNIDFFQRNVLSSCVFSNISTRFSDGGEFGLGAEIGISTDKLHARGPMGVRELTTYKYLAEGNGQIRT